eukprot:NODE_9743_length_568_cov_11.638202_g9105_i0.p1 GENE.NODE_9743_length_568_cov_11.638202_g9105_i0~~NODE_9743_length_568_cov_11.638202_g9105_i0.p1  ORF type:complete len:148 (-),score=27.54 NODE_9743_length_568_cov_11.638202_g9105_i0:68-511(-)
MTDACLGLCGVPEATDDGEATVQAKAYFANERTFLGWQGISTLLGMLSLALLQIDTSSASQGASVWCMIAACMFLVYSLIVFKKREYVIKRGGSYDESGKGPTFLVVMLIFSFILMALFQNRMPKGKTTAGGFGHGSGKRGTMVMNN